MVAQVILVHFVLVRIQVRQPFFLPVFLKLPLCYFPLQGSVVFIFRSFAGSVERIRQEDFISCWEGYLQGEDPGRPDNAPLLLQQDKLCHEAQKDHLPHISQSQ